jgi:hypothetical protein
MQRLPLRASLLREKTRSAASGQKPLTCNVRRKMPVKNVIPPDFEIAAIHLRIKISRKPVIKELSGRLSSGFRQAIGY